MKTYRLKKWYPGLSEGWLGTSWETFLKPCGEYEWVLFFGDTKMDSLFSKEWVKRHCEYNPEYWEEVQKELEERKIIELLNKIASETNTNVRYGGCEYISCDGYHYVVFVDNYIRMFKKGETSYEGIEAGIRGFIKFLYKLENGNLEEESDAENGTEIPIYVNGTKIKVSEGDHVSISGTVLSIGKEPEITSEGVFDFIEKNFPEKPPLGVIPEWLHKQNRLESLNDAIDRYKEDGRDIPYEWLQEREKIEYWIRQDQGQTV